MATRRTFNFSGAKDFLHLIQQNELAKERAQMEDQMLIRRQAIQRRDQNEQQDKMNATSFMERMEPKLSSGDITPEAIGNLAKTFNVRGLDLGSMAKVYPSEERRTADVVGKMSDAKSLGDVPTEEALRGVMGQKNLPTMGRTIPTTDEMTGTPQPEGESIPNIPSKPWEVAAAARQATYNKLKKVEPTSPVNDIDPNSGLKREKFVRNSELADLGSLQTEPTPAQKGANEGATKLAAAPGEGAAQAAIEDLTRKGKVTTAGLTAAASREPIPEAVARARAIKKATEEEEWSPNVIAGKMRLKTAEVSAELMKAGRLEQMKEVNAVSNTLISLIPEYDEVKRLSAAVNTRPAGWSSLTGRAKDEMKGNMGIDPEMTRLVQLRDGLALKMANSIGGNKGTTSEGDKKAMYMFIPGPFDPEEVAQDKIRAFSALKDIIPQMLSQSDINDPPAVRIQKAQKLYELYQMVQKQKRAQ